MLFFDNLATIFGVTGAMIFVLGFTPEFIYKNMMGGACVSFAWGNIVHRRPPNPGPPGCSLGCSAALAVARCCSLCFLLLIVLRSAADRSAVCC